MMLTQNVGIDDNGENKKKFLKILFILPNIRGGGAERTTLNVIRGLDRSRFIPMLFLSQNSGEYWDEIPDDVEVFTGLEEEEKVIMHPIKLLRKVIKASRDADIIIGAMELTSLYLAVLAGKMFKHPAIGWIRIDLDHYHIANRWEHTILSRFFYPRTSAIIAVSQGVADSVVRFLPQLRDRIRVLYTPLDVATIREKAQEPLDINNCLPSQGPLILGVGRLEYQKNFGLLIRAHAHVLKKGIEHQLLIIGEGEERSNLERLVQELGLESSVGLPGFFLNPYPIMRKASVFVLSSRFEGLPGVVREAMALGIPVVATDCPSGSAELLEDNRYGILLPPDDVEAMAEAITRVLTDPQMACSMSQAGMKRADNFRPENTIPQFEKMFLEISAMHAG